MMKDKTTDENVIPFRGPSRDRRLQTKEERKTESDEQLKRHNAWARRAIEEKFDKKPMVQSERERIRLAKNLWQIFDDVSSTVSTKDVLHAVLDPAGQLAKSESTKRLYFYALNPDLPVQDKRAEKLTKSIQKYKRFAVEAARLSGKDESTLIRQLVAGTSYAQLEKDIDIADSYIDAEAWPDIVTAIQLATARISQKYDLPRFFKRVLDLRIGMRWEFIGSDPEVIYPSALVHDHRLPLRPSVYLGDARVCDDIPCTIVPWMYEPREEDEQERKLYMRLLEAGLNKGVAGVATPVLRASIELLPLSKQNLVTPILRVKSRTYIALADDFTEFVPFGGLGWSAGEMIDEFTGPLGDELDNDGYLAATDLESKTSVYCEIAITYESDPGAAYFNSLHSKSSGSSSWILPFDDSAIECLSKQITRPDFKYRTKSGLWDLSSNSKKGTQRPRSFRFEGLTSFPPDSMAELLERSLFYEPEETARLDHLLDEKTRILTQELEERIEQARASRRKRLDELGRE